MATPYRFFPFTRVLRPLIFYHSSLFFTFFSFLSLSFSLCLLIFSHNVFHISLLCWKIESNFWKFILYFYSHELTFRLILTNISRSCDFHFLVFFNTLKNSLRSLYLIIINYFTNNILHIFNIINNIINNHHICKFHLWYYNSLS